MIIEKIPELQQFTLTEKAILASELLEELSGENLVVSGDEGHFEILLERKRHFESNPDSTVKWEDLKKEFWGNE